MDQRPLKMVYRVDAPKFHFNRGFQRPFEIYFTCHEDKNLREREQMCEEWWMNGQLFIEKSNTPMCLLRWYILLMHACAIRVGLHVVHVPNEMTHPP